MHGDYALMTDPDSEQKEEDIIDESVHKVLLKGTFSLCQELGDLVNTIIFMIYFEFYSGLNFSSLFGEIHLAVFILKIVFEVVDITQNVLHLWFHRTHKAQYIITFTYIKLHFSLFFTLYIVYFSYAKLSNPETFWCSVLFVSNVFKSFYNIQIKLVLEMYNNAIKSLFRDHNESEYSVILVADTASHQHSYTTPPRSQSSDCCLIAAGKQMYRFLYSKLDDIVVYLFPCLVFANCAVYSMLVMGPRWIEITFLVWFTYVFSVAFCYSCHCQCKLYLVYLALFFNIIANILAGFSIFLYHMVYSFGINKSYTLSDWNAIGQYWYYGISNAIMYLLITGVPLIVVGPKEAFCGWLHCEGEYASTWTIDKVYLSLTYVVTFAAPGIILAVIHPWPYGDGCSYQTHQITVAIALAVLFGVSLLFCLNCHAAALCNCRTGPNFHDSSGIRRRCHGCMCLMAMTSLIMGCAWCYFYTHSAETPNNPMLWQINNCTTNAV
eukprot:CAMPEP_0197034040 /NCGR_PEP_ID=MMETSP1384-20130603/12261_1 /TAXON_ID=29189 /ORGANISM="Ammonia sp." /LENGTH=493 /DNA_ID=CAMNT_0042463915 /DNA_START=173 /DNA_END=1654 /DNA_ORIENTATION=+